MSIDLTAFIFINLSLYEFKVVLCTCVRESHFQMKEKSHPSCETVTNIGKESLTLKLQTTECWATLYTSLNLYSSTHKFSFQTSILSVRGFHTYLK